jgi:predicted MPP superfamily phosphohydrolase
MAILSVTFNLLFLLLTLACLWLLKRWKFRYRILLALLLGVSLFILDQTIAIISPAVHFGQIQLMAFAFFLHLPIYLGGVTILFLKSRPGFAAASASLAGLILAIGLYASLIEPHWLEISHYSLTNAKLQEPIRVAVVADLQTDHPGEFEETVLRAVKKEDPDLILLAGDYLQFMDAGLYPPAQKTLRDMFQHLDLDPPLGIFAVRGNVDPVDSWQKTFEELPIYLFENSSSMDLGPMVLTGLTLEDSENVFLSVEGTEKFHIVLGHRPDFSLGEIQADLLIAGHTHGGQVQLPFIGPLATLSAVPRSWASGVTTISPGKILLVSRGVGMERGNAPRMRFNCRPELVILDLLPSDSSIQ